MLALLIAATGCTHHEGPSGNLFGRWVFDRIEAENMDVPEQDGTLFIAFQSSVCELKRNDGDMAFSTSFGIFHMDDGYLYLDFPQQDNPPFKQTGLARNNVLKILKFTRKELVLLYHPEPDASLIYYLRKW